MATSRVKLLVCVIAILIAAAGLLLAFRPRGMEPDPRIQGVAGWAFGKLAASGKQTALPDILANAIVARAGDDGKIEISGAPGRNGAGTLWPTVNPAVWWLAVQRMPVKSGSVERTMVWAHPLNKSTLVIGLPQLPVDKPVNFTYGLADTALQNKTGADVEAWLLADGRQVMKIVQPNRAGWTEQKLDLSGYGKDGKADVLVLVRTAQQNSRHFVFDITP